MHQLVYFPYLSLNAGDSIRFGSTTVWDARAIDGRLATPELQERVRVLLDSHRAPTGAKGKSKPLTGIGVVATGFPTLSPLSSQDLRNLQEFRYALFLSCLSHNVKLQGPNAGHYLLTAENFSFITQNFRLESVHISEEAGLLVRITNMGYRIGEVEFPTPTYVPHPIQFYYDQDLHAALWRLRRANRRLYRRVMGAAALFLESYHNSQSVDIRARILLQVAAFELLLQLPERGPRKALKDEMEALCCSRSDRKYSFTYEHFGSSRREKRTQIGIWADRFYTLRNHIIHGEEVPRAEYMYRGVQHHLNISPAMMILAIRRLVGRSLTPPPPFYDQMTWKKGGFDEDDEENVHGFQLEADWGAFIEWKLANVRVP